MLHSGKARANYLKAQQDLANQIKRQQLQSAPLFVVDKLADPRHVEHMLNRNNNY